ncbi:MAG: hypothetical protein WCA39_16105 [Nitrososphaeraceae archaeon]
MNRQELESNVNSKFDESVAYLENNRFMGLVEKAGADVIIGSAKQKGLRIEGSDCWLNVKVEVIQ